MSNHYVLSNGNLLINFNRFSNITDLYFPFVGHPNHVGGALCGLAIVLRDRTLWVGDGWTSEGEMLQGSLVARVTHTHRETGLRLQLTQAVHHADNALLSSVELSNPDLDEVNFGVAFYHNFTLNENVVGDTAVYLPDPASLLHYKEETYLLAGARDENGQSFRRWDIGRRDGSAAAGWESINSRQFSNCPIRQGNVDSVLVLDLICARGKEAAGDYWLIAAQDLSEARQQARKMSEASLPLMLEQTHVYWQEWSSFIEPGSEGGPARHYDDALRRSLLLVRSQCDNRGGIIAANDTQVLRFNGDHYSYVWPRDGALVARILLNQGIPDLAARFLSFCGRVTDESGVILHKYRANGTLGSSWHGWLQNGQPVLPIQEDEIALPVLLLADFFDRTHNIELARNQYLGWGQKCLRFLEQFRTPETKLPKPSHDLWEERYGVHAFTVASVWAALARAAKMAQRLGFISDAEPAFAAAEEVKVAFLQHFWSEEKQAFARCIYENGEKDFTPDSSLYSIWHFGILEDKDPRVRAAMNTLWGRLQVRCGTGGIARYHDDYYFRVTENLEEVPGNPWVISTLWAAQWFLRTGETDRAVDLVETCLRLSNQMGLLPEQWNPYDATPRSVIPLTWSHAVMVETLALLQQALEGTEPSAQV